MLNLELAVGALIVALIIAIVV
ncbi:truncated vpu protein [Human immunodeficiency virus 1]|uniref:Truncated vpu protein n=1 Tax=Human immunodeficiency virus type 1 TaxID=11676 RepID=Q9DKF1_HV1|nr:truncated vpu protein [Human immunodeficiency virus 1]